MKHIWRVCYMRCMNEKAKQNHLFTCYASPILMNEKSLNWKWFDAMNHELTKKQALDANLFNFVFFFAFSKIRYQNITWMASNYHSVNFDSIQWISDWTALKLIFNPLNWRMAFFLLQFIHFQFSLVFGFFSGFIHLAHWIAHTIMID